MRISNRKPTYRKGTETVQPLAPVASVERKKAIHEILISYQNQPIKTVIYMIYQLHLLDTPQKPAQKVGTKIQTGAYFLSCFLLHLSECPGIGV